MKKEYYQKKLAELAKLADLISMQVGVGNLEVNKNNTTCH
jgi:hypothetical protein